MAMVAVFGLVLGFSSIPLSKVNAQIVMVTGSITASPGTICAGESSNISWATTDATSITISPTIGSGLPAYGDRDVSPTQTTTYTMTLSNNSGGYGQTSATVYVSGSCGGGDSVPTVTLTADDNSLNPGQTTRLRWTVTNDPDTCTASGAWSGRKDENGGSESIGPISNSRTYTITCSNSAGFDVASETVTFNDDDDNDGERPDVTTNPATNIDRDEAILRGDVDGNGLSTRVWFEYSRDKDDVEDGDGTETSEQSTGSGSQDFSRRITGLRENTTYHFRAVARNSEGTDLGNIRSFRTDDDDDDNDDDEDRPTVDIFANPTSVNYNGSSIITWRSTDADSCRSSGGTSGWSTSNRGRSGTFYANSLTRDTTFSITCENDEGTDSDSVTVRVGNIIVNNNRPTVYIYADSTNIAYNSATTVRWSTTNATSCFASGGSVGWAGTRSIGPGSFYTGSLTGSRTYVLTCSNSAGSDTDSVTVSVRPRIITTTPPSPTSLVLITSSIDRNQPILPTLDNTRPRAGDEINYTVTYQNIGTASITNLVLRLDLPYEVDYMFSNPNNPIRSGNTLIFNLGTLRANGTGTVTVRVRVREDAAPGALLNFPAVLSYTDPSGFPQSVSANVSAQVWSGSETIILDEGEKTIVPLGASIFGAGFWPTTLFGWLLFLILILILILLVRSLYAPASPMPWSRKTITTTVQH